MNCILPSYIWAYWGNPAALSHLHASCACISEKKQKENKPTQQHSNNSTLTKLSILVHVTIKVCFLLQFIVVSMLRTICVMNQVTNWSFFCQFASGWKKRRFITVYGQGTKKVSNTSSIIEKGEFLCVIYMINIFYLFWFLRFVAILVFDTIILMLKTNVTHLWIITLTSSATVTSGETFRHICKTFIKFWKEIFSTSALFEVLSISDR